MNIINKRLLQFEALGAQCTESLPLLMHHKMCYKDSLDIFTGILQPYVKYIMHSFKVLFKMRSGAGLII